MVVNSSDPRSAAVAAPAMNVQIWCEHCMSANVVDISIVWRRSGKNRFSNVCCMPCKSMTIIGDWFRCQNTEASRINDWLQQDSVDGQSRLQIYSLYTGHSKSHILDGHTLSIMKRVENNGDCQSDQHSPSKRPLPTGANDNAKKQRRDDQSSSSPASGMTSQVPAVLCYGRVLRVHLVSDVLILFLRRHTHKDACLQALEAGGGGD